MVITPKIAVIGGGTAGIITCRQLLLSGFKTHLFEKSNSIGGIWYQNKDRKIWDSMTTNLSKYTCCFSDFMPLEKEEKDKDLFLSANDVNDYLEAYFDSYIKHDDNFKFHSNCEIVKIVRQPSAFDNKKIFFELDWKEGHSEIVKNKFDGVVIASGFFSKPKDTRPDTFKGLYMHSSEYRSIKQFQSDKIKNIIIIGSSFSALEIASDLAKDYDEVLNPHSIHVILPSVPYVIPRYIPSSGSGSSTSTRYMTPIDFEFYKRTKSFPTTENLFPSKEECQKKHAYLQSIGGSMQSHILTQKNAPLIDTSKPPHAAISDSFLNFLALERIKVYKNERFLSCPSSNSLELSSGKILENIDAIISCTGYRTDLSFLDQDILKTLHYDSKASLKPIIACHDVYHPHLPNLAFVGMYKGPYFGTTELQAKLAAQLFTTNWKKMQHNNTEALLEEATQMRYLENPPQFPHPDYVGFMDRLYYSLEKEAPHKNLLDENSELPVVPSFYSHDFSKEMENKLEKEISEQKNGSIVPAVLISRLIGKFKYHRDIYYISNSIIDESTRETVDGTIIYTPIPDKKNTLLYREDGIYQTSKSKFDIYREYEYVLNNDALEIYFREGQSRAHLFVSLKFFSRQVSIWESSDDHLCVKDLYKCKFCIEFDPDGGIGIQKIKIEYRVKGPYKDYVSITEMIPSYLLTSS